MMPSCPLLLVDRIFLSTSHASDSNLTNLLQICLHHPDRFKNSQHKSHLPPDLAGQVNVRSHPSFLAQLMPDFCVTFRVSHGP